GRAMKGCYLRGQRVDMNGGKTIIGKRVARQRILREFTHLHRILDCRPLAAERGLVDASSDRDDFEIEFRCKATIQPQFLFAKKSTSFQHAEIQKSLVHRLLDLVRELPGQENIGNVRLEHADALYA